MSGSAGEEGHYLTSEPDKNPPETPQNEGECQDCQECQVFDTDETNETETNNDWGEI